MKGNKGITLIALVITIIVLLILAGVAIAMLSGDNGILKRAQDAEKASTQGEAEEAVKLAVAALITDKYAEGASTSNAITGANIVAKIKLANANATVVAGTDGVASETNNAYAAVNYTLSNGKVREIYVLVDSGKILAVDSDATDKTTQLANFIKK